MKNPLKFLLCLFISSLFLVSIPSSAEEKSPSQNSRIIYKDKKDGVTLTAVLTSANPKQVSILLESKPSHNTRIEKVKLKGPSGKKYTPTELLRGTQVRRLGKTEAEDKTKQKLITEALKETEVKKTPTAAPTTGGYPVCPTCGQSHPPGPCPTKATTITSTPEEKVKSPEEQAAIATALGLLTRAKDTTREEIVLATFVVDEAKTGTYACETNISRDGKIIAFNFVFDMGGVVMAEEAATTAVCNCQGEGCRCRAPFACGGAIHVDVIDPEYGMISKLVCGGPLPCQCMGEGCRCIKPLICGGAIHIDVMDTTYGMISKWICGRIDRGGIGIPGGEEEEPVPCDCGGGDCACEKKGDCEGIKRCKTDGCQGQDCDCEDYCEEMPCHGSKECARAGCRGENCQCGRYCKRRPCNDSIACACGGRDCRISDRPAWRGPRRRGERPAVGCKKVCERFPTAPCGGAKTCRTEKCGTSYGRVLCTCQPYCIRRPCQGAEVCNCGNLNVECNHCQRAVCKSSNEQNLKCKSGCPIERGISESVCCREPQSRSLGSCPGVYGGAWWGEHHINIVSVSAEWCGALSQNTLPADSSFSDYFRIGSYCGGNSRCVGQKEHNINILTPTPMNHAACLENIAGAGESVGDEAECGQCGDTDKCVHDYDQTNNFLGYLAGSGGCWPGIGGGFTAMPVGGNKECTVYWSDPCSCRRPCGAGTSVTRGSGRESVTFATLPCGGWICNLKVTGHPCVSKQEGSPCFCY